MSRKQYMRGFLPYGTAALLVGLVGGFSAVLGPAFVKDMGIAYNNTTWTALATAMSTAAFAPVMGKLSDLVGRKRMLLAGLGVYTLGNALTALAPNLTVMLLARFLLGTGAAAIAPVVIAYILTEFPQEKVAYGFSMYMLISSASVVIGPTAGLWIINQWGWRVMIWSCVAFCLLALIYALFFREENVTNKEALNGFDSKGAVQVLIFFSLLLCIPSFGQNFGWDSGIFRVIFVVAVLSLLALVSVEQKAENPILPLGFLKQKTFLLPVLALFLTQGLMQANMTNTIIFVEHTQPGNTTVSGYAISVMYIGMALGSVFIGPLADKMEPKQILTGSLLLTMAGAATMLLFTQRTSVILLMLSLGVLGFGLGGNGTIFLKVVFSGLSQKDSGVASGTYGLFRDLAAPFGVAVLVPLFTYGVTSGMEVGLEEAEAAVRAVRYLAVAEILSVAAGIVVVRLLPAIHTRKTQIDHPSD